MNNNKGYDDIHIGDTFGKWTIIGKGNPEKDSHNNVYWLCKCSCEKGTIRNVRGTQLRNKVSMGCGCAIQKPKEDMSFYDFCVQNNRQDILNRISDKTTIDIKEVCCYSQNTIWLKCPNCIHEDQEFRIVNISKHLDSKCNCVKCNSIAQKLIDLYGDNALELYWDYNKNILNPWEINYGSIQTKVWIKCQEKDYHGSYEVICSNLSKGYKCPYCINHHGKVHLLDSLGTLYPQVIPIWSDKNKKSPFEYAPMSNQKVWWKCADNKHKDYYRDISASNACEFRCSECTNERQESLLQEKVRTYITDQLGYKLNHEYNCTLIPQNPKMKNKNGRFPFDNEIIDLKLIIEVNGEQHYNTRIFKTTWKHKNLTPEEQLHKQKLHDRYKRFTAHCNGYYYVEIPYWTDDKKEDWKKLIDNKIEEILANKSRKESA